MSTTQNEARNNRVPPKLRRECQNSYSGVKNIRRTGTFNGFRVTFDGLTANESELRRLKNAANADTYVMTVYNGDLVVDLQRCW